VKTVIAFILVVFTSTAFAEQPWETGVPKDKRDQAQKLFEEGNVLFTQQAHQPALEKYKTAIALWDHPLIRLNMAVSQIRLDRILEAAEDIDAALRFGQSPFTAELYQRALDYQRLVGGRVGNVEASCDQDKVQVLLDGKPWFACPGSKKLRVLSGEHVIVGEKEGFGTISKRVVVAGGKTSSQKLELVPMESLVKYEYPSPAWLPWTTAGGGAAIALGGLGFWFAGRNQMDNFEAEFAMECPTGCEADLSAPEHQDLKRDRDSAELKGKIAVVMMATGGALVVGGVVWAIINRPKRVMPDMEVGPTSGGMAASVRWRF
jgi:membrane protein implicated in regulation of membrane protease activity